MKPEHQSILRGAVAATVGGACLLPVAFPGWTQVIAESYNTDARRRSRTPLTNLSPIQTKVRRSLRLPLCVLKASQVAICSVTVTPSSALPSVAILLTQPQPFRRSPQTRAPYQLIRHCKVSQSRGRISILALPHCAAVPLV